MPLPSDEPNDEEKLEELPEDEDTPFSIPSDPEVDIEDGPKGKPKKKRPLLGSTDPATDSNIELEELYDEGLSGAAEAGEPNPNDAVIAYHAPKRHKPDVKRKSG